MAYEYDFFVSYTAKTGAGKWTNKYFVPTFIDAFMDEVGHQPNIYNFVDREIAVTWPDEVADALHKSRYMIAILTPPYFTMSPWCSAEWATMSHRESLVQFPASHAHQRLIIPVVYSDGDHFPGDAKTIRHFDMRKFSYPDEAFVGSADFMRFRDEMRSLARSTAKMLEVAPPWDAAWPPLRKPAITPAKLILPRL